MTIEHYPAETQLEGMPPELPELLRFLRHAAGAIEDVTLRTAFRLYSGCAALSANSIRSNLDCGPADSCSRGGQRPGRALLAGRAGRSPHPAGACVAPARLGETVSNT